MHSPSPRKPRVWIVDDSPLERAATLRALGSTDFEYEQFADGADVVERLARGDRLPDIILLDWVMPGLSGDEVCRYIRSQQGNKDVAIILSTASRVETMDIVEGLALGVDDYVAKPFAPEELRARVSTVLRAKQLRDQARRERTRLDAINHLGRALFEAGADIRRILQELIASLHGLVADGCAIMVLPGDLPPVSAAIHGADPSAAALSAVASLADPATFAFASSDDALAQLPPLYHPYIRQFGLRGLAILPFPIRTPIQGVVTLTRDGGSLPFDADDLSTIETCIEYASLAVQNALRFEAERIARTRLHAVFDHAPIGIVVADPAGAISLVNPKTSRLLPGIEAARTLDDAYSLGAWSTIDGAAIERAAWSLGRGGEHNGADHRLLVFTPAGGAARVLSLTTVTRQEVDELAGTVTAIEDVTAQHSIAVERERVAAFQEQMVGIVGHDLRTPLHAIVTGIELIHERARDLPQIQSVVRRIQSSSRRMTSIVNQLLDVTRARLGDGIPLALSESALASIAQSVVDEIQPSYPAATFELVTTDVRGMWDADRLTQVISNLVGNAVQYGDITAPIKVTVGRDEERALISVANALRGQPIPAERLAALFEPYRRGEDSMTAHRTGLGLGLYIAHEIVQAHRGRITARSSPAGTVFTVELPLRAQPRE